MIGTFLSDYVVDRLGWLLIHSLWQLTVMALGTMVALRVMRRASATVRYWVCLAALTATVVGPAISWWFLPEYARQQKFNDLVFQSRGDSQPDNLAIASSINRTVVSSAPEPTRRLAEVTPRPVVSSPTHASPRGASRATSWRVLLEAMISPWLKELVAAWCLGVFLFALRPIWSCYTLHRLAGLA